jgi:hypothetical protein
MSVKESGRKERRYIAMVVQYVSSVMPRGRDQVDVRLRKQLLNSILLLKEIKTIWSLGVYGGAYLLALRLVDWESKLLQC